MPSSSAAEPYTPRMSPWLAELPDLAGAEALGEDPHQVLLDRVVDARVGIGVVAARQDEVDRGALRDAARPLDVEVRLEAPALLSRRRGARVRNERGDEGGRRQAELGAKLVDVALTHLADAHDADGDAGAVDDRRAGHALRVELRDVVDVGPVRRAQADLEAVPVLRPRAAHPGHGVRVEVVGVVKSQHHVGQRGGHRRRRGHRVVHLAPDLVLSHRRAERSLQLGDPPRERHAGSEG